MKKKAFSTQNDTEIVIKIANRHPITLIRDAFGSIVLFFLSLMVMVFAFGLAYVLIFAFIFFLFSIIGFFYSYFTWERDKYIITDQRVVDIDQISLFTKSQKEAMLDKVQDVSSEIKGVLGTIFRYGNVHIQTASDTSLTINDVANPEKIQKIIFDLVQNKGEAEKKQDSDSNLMEKMTEMIRKAIREEKDEENKKSG